MADNQFIPIYQQAQANSNRPSSDRDILEFLSNSPVKDITLQELLAEEGQKIGNEQEQVKTGALKNVAKREDLNLRADFPFLASDSEDFQKFAGERGGDTPENRDLFQQLLKQGRETPIDQQVRVAEAGNPKSAGGMSPQDMLAFLNIQRVSGDLKYDNPQIGDTSILGSDITVTDPVAAKGLRKNPTQITKLQEALDSESDFVLRLNNLTQAVNNIEGDLPLSTMFGDGKDLLALTRETQLYAKSEGVYALGVLAGPDMDLLEAIIQNPTGAISKMRGKEEFTRSYRRLSAVQFISSDKKLTRRGLSRTYWYDPTNKSFVRSLENAPKGRQMVRINSENSEDTIKALKEKGLL